MKKLLLLSLSTLLLTCKNNSNMEETDKPIEEVIEVIKEVTLTPKQIFLKENGINSKSDISDDEFAILEKAVKAGLFKEKSFCQFYEEYKTLEFAKKYKQSDEVIASFSKVDHLGSLLAIKGYQLCPEAIKKAKEDRDGPKYIYSSVKTNPCKVAKHFIKKDLQRPSTASFSMFDCTSEKNSDGSYTILRKVSAKNSLGLELDFIYKVRLGFTGGNEVDMKNWKLIGIISEEYGK